MTYASNVDLTRFAGAILDQGSAGTCFENALVSTIDTMMRQAGHPIAPLSRLQPYYDTREAQHTLSTDSGTVADFALNAAMAKGIGAESLWAYDISKMFTKPSDAVYADALTHKVLSWSAVSPTLTYIGLRDAIKGLLDQGKPVILGFFAESYFFNESGPIATQVNSGPVDRHAGHAVEVVRCDDNLNGGSYVVKNSWNTTWGDHGYGTIKYSEFNVTPTQNELIGAWTINGFAGLDFTYTPERTRIGELYADLFNRASDNGGLFYWSDVLKTHQIAEIADYMLASPEAAAIYGGHTTSQIVNMLYQNILGRDADAGGLLYYMNLINSHQCTKGQVLTSIAHNIQQGFGTEHDRLVNRADMSDYFGIALQSNNTVAAHDAMTGITYDPNTVEIVKVGIGHELGLY